MKRQNRRRIAFALIALARKIAAKPQESGFYTFQKHVVEGCKAEALRVQRLLSWCQAHHNAATEKLGQFTDLNNIISELNALAKRLGDVEPK